MRRGQSRKASWRRCCLHLEHDRDHEFQDGEGISGKKAWKEDLSVPNDGVDIKFRHGGKAG